MKKLVIYDYDLLEVDKIAIQIVKHPSEDDPKEFEYFAELVKLMRHAESDDTIAIVEPTNIVSLSKEESIRQCVTVSYKLYGAEIIDTAIVLDSSDLEVIEKLSITEILSDNDVSIPEESTMEDIVGDTSPGNKTLH